MRVERCVIDNRVFLLGLDQLYRDAMKRQERGELLSCARRVTAALGVAPADVPIEGYYGEHPDLTEYFRLMRALQDVSAAARDAVAGLAEFRRLDEVTSAPLFGRAQDVGKLLPVGRDPLSQALSDTAPDWAAARLTATAATVARDWDDFSLVGLAARWGDAVVLAALRESVVLYAEFMCGGLPPTYEFVWRVDPELTTQAQRFIGCFNALFGRILPAAVADQAEAFWWACKDNEIVGRCVRLGHDDSTRPVRHYHWAVRPDRVRGPSLHEFWDTDVWTTQRYRASLGLPVEHETITLS